MNREDCESGVRTRLEIEGSAYIQWMERMVSHTIKCICLHFGFKLI